MPGKLISLEERMEQQLHAFGYVTKDEARRNTARDAGIGVGAAGALAGAGYGAHKARQAVINKYGVTDDYGNRVARKGMYRDAAAPVKAEAERLAGNAGVRAKRGVAKAKYAAKGGYNEEIAKAGKKAVGRGGRYIGRTMVKAGGGAGWLSKTGQRLTKAVRGFEEIDELIDLAERIAGLELEHEFGSTLNAVQRKYQPESEEERAAYHRKWNNRRMGLAGAITAGAGGTLVANKARNAVINKYGVVDDYGSMVGRKGMYKQAGGDALKAAKASKAGVAATDALKKGRGWLKGMMPKPKIAGLLR